MDHFNYSKLLGCMKEQGFTQGELAKQLGMNASTLNLKLNNRSWFSQEEIELACDKLRISIDRIPEYFFAH